MFCPNCGNQVDTNERFCGKCGSPIQQGDQPVFNNSNGEKQSKKKNRKVGIIATIVIVAIIAVVAVKMFSGNSYEDVVDTLMEVSFGNFDAKEVMGLLPDEVVDVIVEEEFDGDKDMLIETIDSYVAEYMEELEDEISGFEISYEILNETNLSKSDIRDIVENYEEYFDITLDISEAKEVEVELIVTGDDEEDSDTLEMTLIKIGRKWYLDFDSFY